MGLIRAEFTEPHDIDFHLGMFPSRSGRGLPRSTTPQCRHQNDGPDRVADVNTAWWQALSSPSNGHGNARSVKQLLSLLTRHPAIDRDPLGEGALNLVRTVDWDGPDPVTGTDVRMGVGRTQLSIDAGWGERRDGVVAGLGGSMAVVDPEQDLVVVYAMNRMLLDDHHVMRSIRVVHAAHTAVRARPRAGVVAALSDP